MTDQYKNLADSLNLDKDSPVAKRIYGHLDEIDNLLKFGITGKSGISVKTLVNKLNENGFDIKLRVFETTLYRARKKAKNGNINQVENNKSGFKTVQKSETVNNSNIIEDDSEKQTQKQEFPTRRKTLKEISAEVDKMLAEDEMPLYR